MKKGKILVADDEQEIVTLLCEYLSEQGYEVMSASDGVEALRKIYQTEVDLVFLDIMMGGITGIEVLKRIKSNSETRDIPVIMLSSLADHHLRIEALSSEANEFLLKPFDRVELLVRVKNLLNMKKFNDTLKTDNKQLEKKFREKVSHIEKDFKELSFVNKKIKEGYLETIFRLAVVAEYKDKLTAAYHIKRISYYAAVMADALGLTSEEKESIFYASPMHDIGKIEIPERILTKPSKLTREEFSIMELHTTIGAKILSGSSSYVLKTASIISLSHHEKWDASGYPLGLEGESIPIEGRIVNIIDQYDTLRTERSYGATLDHINTVKIITDGDGRTLPTHFDPRILKAFKDSASRFEEIYETLSPEVGKA